MEFALVLPVFLTLIGGLLVLALAMAYSGLAEHAARVGLRKAVIRTSDGYPDAAMVRNTINSALSGLMPNPDNPDATLLIRDPQDLTNSPRGAQGDRVTVQVDYTIPVVSSALSLIPDAGLRNQMAALATIERTAVGRLE